MANRKPTRVDLILAAQKYNEWLERVAPGGLAFLCGGLALSLYGNVRQTEDADLALDLSHTHREGGKKYDTNQLKFLASQSPGLFIVGPKIYLRLYTEQPDREVDVQVDFVDAALFYSPWNAEAMIDRSPELPVPCLNLPTLLVGKIKSAPERKQGTPQEILMKQANDVLDANFAVADCLRRNYPLGRYQIDHLGSNDDIVLFSLRDFFQLTAKLERDKHVPSMNSLRERWAELIQRSGCPKKFGDVAFERF